jgi:ComF family protein
MRRLFRISIWVWRAFLALLVRPRCTACDRRLEAQAVFCAPCLATVTQIAGSAALGGVRVAAFGAYGAAVGDALRRFKYRARPDLALPLGELLRRRVDALRGRFDIVVPVPLHPRRLAARGYNQAALLARPIARELGLPLRTRALRRVLDTPAQAKLDGAARRRNVENAFVASRCVAGRRVLLVDDIATTGATLQSCAHALRNAGATECEALVVARSGV